MGSKRGRTHREKDKKILQLRKRLSLSACKLINPPPGHNRARCDGKINTDLCSRTKIPDHSTTVPQLSVSALTCKAQRVYTCKHLNSDPHLSQSTQHKAKPQDEACKPSHDDHGCPRFEKKDEAEPQTREVNMPVTDVTGLTFHTKLTLRNKTDVRERRRAKDQLCPNTLLIILLGKPAAALEKDF